MVCAVRRCSGRAARGGDWFLLLGWRVVVRNSPRQQVAGVTRWGPPRWVGNHQLGRIKVCGGWEGFWITRGVCPPLVASRLVNVGVGCVGV